MISLKSVIIIHHNKLNLIDDTNTDSTFVYFLLKFTIIIYIFYLLNRNLEEGGILLKDEIKFGNAL